MGIIKNRVNEAFDKLDKGLFVEFLFDLIDIADTGVRFQWQRSVLDEAILERLKGLETLDKKTIQRIKQLQVENEV